LLDADRLGLSIKATSDQIIQKQPDVVLVGHSGSTSAHPIIAKLVKLVRLGLPKAQIVYGGVFPTYHWREVLHEVPEIDFVVRGEGEGRICLLTPAAVNAAGRPTMLVSTPMESDQADEGSRSEGNGPAS